MTKYILTLAALLVAACGFHPVYGVNKYTNTGVEEHLQRVDIGNIADRDGLYLRNALIDRFYRDGRPQNTLYTLSVERLTESRRDLDITVDSDATRGQLRISTQMRLADKRTGQTLLERDLYAIASYNILASEFTNRVSEQDARENVLDDLAQQIQQHLALYFKREQ